MSMFHELMMRKKEETLYPVIKGSLMESPSGVFSGFSTSNYLQIKNNLQINNNYEVQVAFNYSSFANQAIFSFNTGNVSYLRLTDGGKLMFYLKFAYSQAQSVLIAPNTTLFANNNYIVKLKGSNGHHQMLLSSDNGASWELLGSVDYDFILNFSTFNFGVATSIYSIGFGGSIDLNNSYIKIGSTKYKLQAVVGYTVVGSPTIVDGVVSGFSSGNYLTLPSIPANSYNRIEIKTRVTTENSVNLDGGIICVANAYMQGVSLDYGKFIARVNLGSYNALYSGTISANKEYDIICIIDITNANLTLGIKETSQSVYVNNTIQIDTSNLRAILYYIGNGTLGEFNGSIDMNKTNIKLDNKLWFNGQQS